MRRVTLIIAGLLLVGLAPGCSKPKSHTPVNVPADAPVTSPDVMPIPAAAGTATPDGVVHLPRPNVAPRWPAVHELGMKEVTMDTLARIGRAAAPELVELLRDPDPGLRVEAARTLARMGPEAAPAVSALIAALDDPDDEVRKNVIRALGQIGPPAAKAVPTLVDLLKRIEQDELKAKESQESR